MPQIETWSHLPAAVRAHLVERMHDRKISLQDLNQLRVWIESKPNVPEGPWYKDFGSFKLCGEGDTRKRFLCRGKLLQDRDFSSISLVRFVRLTTISSDDRCGETNTRFHVEWVSHSVDFFNPCEWCFNRVNSIISCSKLLFILWVPLNQTEKYLKSGW